MGTSSAADMTALDAETCLDLLRSEEVGRVVVCIAGELEIFPINYALDAGTVVFRSAEGTKLSAVFVSGSVAFEADGYDADTGDAWSVVLKGTAEEIPMYDAVDDEAFWLFPWSGTVKSRFVRLIPAQISGRRFHVVRTRPSPDRPIGS